MTQNSGGIQRYQESQDIQPAGSIQQDWIRNYTTNGLYPAPKAYEYIQYQPSD